MKLYSIVFSPTGGTQKAASLLAGALEGEAVQVDLTDSKQDFHTVHLMRDDNGAFVDIDTNQRSTTK